MTPKLQSIITVIEDRITRNELTKAFIFKYQIPITELDLQPDTNIIGHVDFNRLSHDKVIQVIQAFGGRWSKELYDDSRITYTRDELLDGIQVRCWAGEPPPSCQIVEEEIEVPEEIVPAHTEIVRKLICK